jgi:hypothetical protein
MQELQIHRNIETKRLDALKGMLLGHILEEVKEVSGYNPGIPCHIYHWAGFR